MPILARRPSRPPQFTHRKCSRPSILSIYVYTSPSKSDASNASRRVMRKVAPIVIYSATIFPFAVFSLYSPTKLYVPAFKAGILSRTVLPAEMTFSMRRSLLSNSSAFLSLLVITRTNPSPALTLISSGWNRLLSIVSGMSGGSAATARVGTSITDAISTAASIARRRLMIKRPLFLGLRYTLLNGVVNVHFSRQGSPRSAVRRGVGARQGLTAVEIERHLVASVPAHGDGADRLDPCEVL